MQTARASTDNYSWIQDDSLPPPNFHPTNPFAPLLTPTNTGSTMSNPFDAPNPFEAPLINLRSPSPPPRRPRPASTISPAAAPSDPPRSKPRKPRPRSSLPAPDTIDRMSNILNGTFYHHEGPYECVLAARQSVRYAPVDAIKEQAEADLAMVPRGNLEDSIREAYPLQATACGPLERETEEEREEREKLEKRRRKVQGWDGLKEDKEKPPKEKDGFLGLPGYEGGVRRSVTVREKGLGGVVRRLSTKLKKRRSCGNLA